MTCSSLSNASTMSRNLHHQTSVYQTWYQEHCPMLASPSQSQVSLMLWPLVLDTSQTCQVCITNHWLDFWLIIYVLISGLQSFCIYASIGLACIFFLQVSWLVAWLVLDERRIRSSQNGLLPCIVHVKENPENNNVVKEEEEEKEKSVKVAKIAFIFKQMKERVVESDVSEVMKNVVRCCISSLYFTLLVLALSAGLLAVGVFGLTQIKYKFDPLILVPSGRVQILRTIFQLQIISFSFWMMMTAYLNNSFRQLLYKISWGQWWILQSTQGLQGQHLHGEHQQQSSGEAGVAWHEAGWLGVIPEGAGEIQLLVERLHNIHREERSGILEKHQQQWVSDAAVRFSLLQHRVKISEEFSFWDRTGVRVTSSRYSGDKNQFSQFDKIFCSRWQIWRLSILHLMVQESMFLARLSLTPFSSTLSFQELSVSTRSTSPGRLTPS